MSGASQTLNSCFQCFLFSSHLSKNVFPTSKQRWKQLKCEKLQKLKLLRLKKFEFLLPQSLPHSFPDRRSVFRLQSDESVLEWMNDMLKNAAGASTRTWLHQGNQPWAASVTISGAPPPFVVTVNTRTRFISSDALRETSVRIIQSHRHRPLNLLHSESPQQHQVVFLTTFTHVIHQVSERNTGLSPLIVTSQIEFYFR